MPEELTIIWAVFDTVCRVDTAYFRTRAEAEEYCSLVSAVTIHKHEVKERVAVDG